MRGVSSGHGSFELTALLWRVQAKRESFAEWSTLEFLGKVLGVVIPSTVAGTNWNNVATHMCECSISKDMDDVRVHAFFLGFLLESGQQTVESARKTCLSCPCRVYKWESWLVDNVQ